jgi:hypothetical protein
MPGSVQCQRVIARHERAEQLRVVPRRRVGCNARDTGGARERRVAEYRYLVARIALLTDVPVHPSTVALIEALGDSAHELSVLSVEDYESWPRPESFDLVLDRVLIAAPGLWRTVLRWIGRARCVSDPREAAAAAGDKLVGSALLRDAGLPVPAFVSVGDAVASAESVEALGAAPWVCKPRSGQQGRGVRLVRSVREAVSVQERTGEPYLLQHRIESPVCYRVLCSCDEVLADYSKVAAPGELVASITLGARRGVVADTGLTSAGTRAENGVGDRRAHHGRRHSHGPNGEALGA